MGGYPVDVELRQTQAEVHDSSGRLVRSTAGSTSKIGVDTAFDGDSWRVIAVGNAEDR
ncbi:hypothetical protein GCM10025865_15810 [Paraoerskovia sediminicola]|uniref:YD repeat-containing protein n=1 Tax=Paraoerskovia sediminicola TaxID=1138587 RepID=A0ABM8G2J5_9CELL|nr:hypothetical protein [Paraoerskovia sediminicola]BDZ42282.1 hypothetical protein GCM10025865_15810 [Paraoerskovia sediminicola]